MAERQRATLEHHMPIELTAPAIQRLARKGLREPLTDAERQELCECVVFHIDAILDQRSVPKVFHGEPLHADPPQAGR